MLEHPCMDPVDICVPRVPLQFEAVSLNLFPMAQAACSALGRTSSSESRDGSSAEPGAVSHLSHLKPGDTQQYMFRLRGKLPPVQLREVSKRSSSTGMTLLKLLVVRSVRSRLPPTRLADSHTRPDGGHVANGHG